jgi:adenylate cyclase
MRHFFAPLVMEALAGRDTDEVLAPREANLSVMFCDLRGFSRRSERDAHDLLQLLARVSDALGVMTRHILDTGGVIGDFHGDAAMGFWGWPLDQQDTAIRAAEAAHRILALGPDNDHDPGARLGDFRCGIGIATGRAVAGRIGTVDQVKVTAFGPVVNLASRLEGLSKAFGAEIVVDGATAAAIGRASCPSLRIRRLGRVRPSGLEKPVEAFELLSPRADNNLLLSDQHIADYEAGLDAWIRGDWKQAHERLHALPVWDRPKDLLLTTILQHNRVPPENWNGVIELPKL